MYKGGVYLQDPAGDAQGSRNIVSDPNHDAAFMYNDGEYVYFRLRLDQDPQGHGGQGSLESFAWGVEIDTNQNSGDYEWLIMLDGISKPEEISVKQNSVQGTLGDPGDETESVCATVPVSTNLQVNFADTSINGDQDYFLDWRVPYSTFKQCSGVTDCSPIRLFFASSTSSNTLTGSGDRLGASDLIAGFSDYVTPFGARPTSDTVKFVADLLGSNDVTLITAGQTIYVRVEDADLNNNNALRQTATVTLTSTGGDSETLILTETGPDTGVFSASIPSLNGPQASDNGIIEVTIPDEIVTVTYIDCLGADLQQNQPLTDTLTVLLPPTLTVAKAVTPSTAAAGGAVTYTITISNSGSGEGFITQITDVLPSGFSYQTGTTTGLTTTNPTINGQILTWTGAWTIVRKSGGVNGTLMLSFQANTGSVTGTYYNNATVSGDNFPTQTSGDTAPVTVAAPLMDLAKSVDKSSAKPGEELIYTIHYRNLGDGPAHTLIIMDTIPLNTTYVAGSLRIGNAASTYATAGAPLTDGPGDDAGEVSGSNIIFNIDEVDAAGSGNDEGKVYFKVRVN